MKTHSIKENHAKNAGEEKASQINGLALTRLQELGLMCQRKQTLKSEMNAVERRIDELNSELQGIGAAFGIISGPSSEMGQAESTVG